MGIKNTVVFLLAAVCVAAFTVPASGFVVATTGYEITSPVKVVVIDPGHGGEDHGATGPSGLKEKDITLSVAKALRNALEVRFDVRAILTREDDRYITLEERTEIANRARADIFISIHANAAYKKAASGVETFFLSFEASDNEARKLAALENNVVKLDTKDGGTVRSDLESILWDLVQTESHHESSRLAELVHNSLVEATGGENRGVKQAPFIVLVGATMPAVLVEVGFVSNPQEERKLADPLMQKRIAKAITEGIVAFGEDLYRRMGYVNIGSGYGRR